MATLALRQVGLSGIEKDVNPNDVPATGLIEARNVRIKNRAITAFSDVTQVINVTASESLLFADGVFRSRELISGVIVVLADTAAGAFSAGFSPAFQVEGQIVVYFYDTAGIRTDISPTIPFTTTTEWFGHRAGSFYILTNSTRQDVPHTWVLTDTGPIGQFAPMPGWPANYRCNFMVSYKNFLVAGGLTIDGTSQPRIVKWSHPLSPGDITTFWDPTDPTILAGENPIVDDVREMTGLQPFKDLLMVYFDRAVWRITFSGGQTVFNFEKAFGDDGALSSRAFADVDAEAYVFGFNDIYKHDGYTKQSISDLRITSHLANVIDPEKRIDAVFYPLNNEILFLARSPGLAAEIDADLVFVYSLTHQAWTEGDIAQNNDGSVALFFLGPNIISGNATETWSGYAPAGGDAWFQAGRATWSGTFQSTERETLYALSLTNDVIYDFDAAVGESTFRENALISHTKIDLDDAGDPVGDRIFYVNRIFPQITGVGAVEFRFGVSRSANSPVEFLETCVFKISKADVNDPLESPEDYACDIRLAGRYLAYEMKPIADSFFSISGFDIELEQVGQQ